MLINKVHSSFKKRLCICNSTFMALAFEIMYFKTVLIGKIFNPNYDFLVPLCLYLVQKYWKSAAANDKWFFATWVNYMYVTTFRLNKLPFNFERRIRFHWSFTYFVLRRYSTTVPNYTVLEHTLHNLLLPLHQ
jgi:hypothetical protein